MDNVIIPVRCIKFSDGSSNIKLEIPEGFNPRAYYSISVDPTTPVDQYLWEILLVLDAIGATFGYDTNFNRTILKLPYLPHGRADRVFEVGNPHPLKQFLLTISKYFDKIYLTDPHSEYYKKHFFRWEEIVEVIPQHQCFIETVGKDIQSGDIMVSPDKGAQDKVYRLQQSLDVRVIATHLIIAAKERDPNTGRILETRLPEVVPKLEGKTCWIVDDICDGGGTFIPLAEKLKKAGASKVNLYVTHGIFAKGLDLFNGFIDNIYCYQTIATYVNKTDIDNFNKGII